MAGLVGCGGEPRTIVTAAAIDNPSATGPDLEFGPAPAASDPTAAALVAEALAAHTDGHPERISVDKPVRITLTGKFIRTDGQTAPGDQHTYPCLAGPRPERVRPADERRADDRVRSQRG